MKKIFEKHFSEIEDKRCQCDVKHSLIDLLIVVMIGVLCGLDEPSEIVDNGKSKQEFLKKHFGIEKIPSRSTICRVMNLIDGDLVGQCTIKIMKELMSKGTEEEIVAIDGKTICWAANMSNYKKALHIITAYQTENGVTIGQLAVSGKTNEIPVVRELIEMLDVKGKTITLDAMHCHKETVEKITKQGGNYVISVKKNQKTLHDDIKLFMDDCIETDVDKLNVAQTVEKNGGRIEDRTCYVATDIDWLENKSEWSELSCIFAIKRKTTVKGKTSVETKYYITNRKESAEKMLDIVRQHWKIESMHWLLDVTFSEDDCRVLSKNGQKVLNIFRKLALPIHKNYIVTNEKKISMRKNMFNSLLNEDLLLDVLKSMFL